MGRRGKKVGPMGGKWNISHSLQMRLALGYSCLIAVLLVLMNTYPLIMGQNLMFRSQQTALANQLVLITNTLTTADELTPETVEQAHWPAGGAGGPAGSGHGRGGTGSLRYRGALRPGEICPHWRGGLRPPGQRRLFQ